MVGLEMSPMFEREVFEAFWDCHDSDFVAPASVCSDHNVQDRWPSNFSAYSRGAGTFVNLEIFNFRDWELCTSNAFRK